MTKRHILFLSISVTYAAMLFSCSHAHFKLTESQGYLIPVDSTWDTRGNQSVSAAILSYKSQIENIMNQPIGESATTLKTFQPESPLSNLAADFLRETASQFLGRPADLAVMNMGGLRTSLSKGTITVGNIYEIFPFENTIIVLTLKGADLLHLFEEIAHRGGEGISGASLQITRNGKLTNCSVQGKPIEPDKEYTIGTIDYLAEGNDGMPSFKKSIKRQDLPAGLLRDMFMNYVKQQTKEGKKIDGRCDGRIKIVEQ